MGCEDVFAGTVSWQRSKRLDDTHFLFYIETDDLDINYMETYMNVSNGSIVSINGQDGWRIRRSAPYIFTHDGIISGHSVLAEVIIELTGNAQYTLSAVKTAAYRCSEHQGYFGPTGNLLSLADYKKQCYSNDTSLASLKVSTGSLQPSFQKNIRNYTMTVENNISKVSFSPTLSDSNGKVLSGMTCDLNVGANTCNILIEAPNGDQGTYQVVVTRKDVTLSSDSTLRSLGVSSGSLSPTFQSNVKSYNLNVGNSVSTITFTPIVNHASARIISGVTCNLNVGINTCNILIEAENGSRSTYSVMVTREKLQLSSDASLKDLSVDHGVLAPLFQTNVKNYVLNVSDEVDKIIFTPVLASNKANVNGTTCDLKMGVNTCNLVVTAEDGTTNTYQIMVMRQKENIEPVTKDYVDVSDLQVSLGELTPSFQPNVFSYTLKLKEKVEWLDFTYLVRYEQDGTNQHGESYRCKLDSDNKCKIVVYSYDKTNDKTYQFQVAYDSESVPEPINPGEVENPQTGDGITTSVGIGVIGFLVISYIFLKKKNLIRKI